MTKPKAAAEKRQPGARDLTIVYRPLDDLKPDPRNARTHSPEQIEQLRASIREFGFTNPILLREDGQIGAGHGRAEAARAEGLAEVPTITLAGLSEAQWRAYAIADNKLALNAGWDLDILRLELGDLSDLGFDLGLTGFCEVDLAGIFATGAGKTDPDDVPEPPAEPVTVLGDVWLMGGHRIVCGDSTRADDVAACLNGAKPHLMVTDPPYGVEYSAGWRNEAMPAKNDPKRWKDGAGRATGAVLNDNRSDWRDAYGLFPGDVAYVWHPAGAKQVEFYSSLAASGFEVRMQIIWSKSNFPIGRGNYHVQHEPCWYAVRKGKTAHWAGDRKQTTVWQIAKPHKSETGHSTQKPVECMKRPIENNSLAGDAVYEPFSGSGTTIIAAEMTGRHCLAIELSPAYVDVAVLRWEAFTGQAARLEATGQTFAEVADARRKQAAA